MSTTPEQELREKLANLQHEQWSGWVEYMFSKGTVNDLGEMVLPNYFFERWSRQLATPYSELPENEKESDRIEADKYLPLFEADKLAAVKEALEKVLEEEFRNRTRRKTDSLYDEGARESEARFIRMLRNKIATLSPDTEGREG